jgi:hypothetical protein
MQFRISTFAVTALARCPSGSHWSGPVFGTACLIAALVIMLSAAAATPLRLSAEDRYLATRDAAIEKLAPIYDAGKADDTTAKAENAARADLQAQMVAMLGKLARKGFGPPQLNLETFYKGDEGFGVLDGLRLDAEFGMSGEKAGGNGADGKYVAPKAHIIITTQAMLQRWLHAHRDWWDKDLKNVPQQIEAALKDERFYTQAIPTDAAVVNFSRLPVAKPASVSLIYGFLAGRTQSELPDTADEVFVAALANGRLYIAYGSIAPKVAIAGCIALRANYTRRSEIIDEKYRSNQIDKKTYDRLGDFRQQGEDAYKRCFSTRAPRQTTFAEATRQAQALVAALQK